MTVDEKSMKWTQLPTSVWKMELETCVKGKGFRANLNTEIIMPFMYMDSWMLSVWDCEFLRRDLLFFKETELS